MANLPHRSLRAGFRKFKRFFEAEVVVPPLARRQKNVASNFLSPIIRPVSSS